MIGEQTKRYRSYLIRCWWSAGAESTSAAVERFIVECVAGEPQRRGFDSFEDLIAFLRVQLLENESEQFGGTSPADES